MACGLIVRPFETLGVLSSFSGYLPLFSFFVDALVGCGEDFGKVGEVEPLDEGKGDSAEVCLRPAFNAANK